jgi:hypothetical protein
MLSDAVLPKVTVGTTAAVALLQVKGRLVRNTQC